jgi:hypothetical protein
VKVVAVVEGHVHVKLAVGEGFPVCPSASIGVTFQ